MCLLSFFHDSRQTKFPSLFFLLVVRVPFSLGFCSTKWWVSLCLILHHRCISWVAVLVLGANSTAWSNSELEMRCYRKPSTTIHLDTRWFSSKLNIFSFIIIASHVCVDLHPTFLSIYFVASIVLFKLKSYALQNKTFKKENCSFRS